LRFFKRPTTPDDPVRGLLDVLDVAAADFGVGRAELLARGELFIHGTTRATNAIVTGSTARTAFLTTQGHPDILLLREGAERVPPYDYTLVYPDPYVPRALTFQVPERIRANGDVKIPLDEAAVVDIVARLRELEVEAVAVCLLWSIVNPVHELRIGELLDEHLPDMPHTLSHELNPSLREYRRASSAAIDASLKPLMSRYVNDLEDRLCASGFAGRLLVLTALGGVLDAREVAQTPIHTIGSGPAAAPVAGLHFARVDVDSDTAIVTDAGGTTYDVSLIRRGRIPRTRETIVGHSRLGYMTGFPSVDVKSIGAGGGSVGWVDEGGLLHVGPQSAGAVPGPAAYGRGGTAPTVTDACVVLGYIDPDYFLGGDMKLEPQLAADAIQRDVAAPLGLELHEAAAAVLNLACERMVNAIEEITLLQGIDPRDAVVIGGGGGAGLYSVAIARRLGSPRVVIPEVAAALSAAGALLSDLEAEYALTEPTTTSSFDADLANRTLEELARRGQEFVAGPGSSSVESEARFIVEARYPHQVWEIEVPLRTGRFDGPDDVEQLRQDFHAVHEELFAIRDVESAVEIVTWRVRVRCRLRHDAPVTRLAREAAVGPARASRSCFFTGTGPVDTRIVRLDTLAAGDRVTGPAIIESRVESIVLWPDSAAERLASGSLLIVPRVSDQAVSDEKRVAGSTTEVR
jgi:N-methylhydantoinase A